VQGECPICGKPGLKSVKSHINMAHPDNKDPAGGATDRESGAAGDIEKEEPSADDEEISRSADAIIVARVNKLLSEMDLSGAIDKAVGARVAQAEEKLSKQVDAVASAIQQNQTASDATAAKAVPGGAGTLQDTILAALATKLIGGNSGGSDFASFLKTMQSFQEASAALYQGPRIQAQREIIDIMKAGYGLGLSTEQVIGGAEKGIESIAKPKPKSDKPG